MRGAGRLRVVAQKQVVRSGRVAEIIKKVRNFLRKPLDKLIRTWYNGATNQRKELIQMKVVVCYTKVVEEIIEVDDQFEKLTDSGGYDDLSRDEREILEGALLETATDLTSAYYHDILRVTSVDTDELMLET